MNYFFSNVKTVRKKLSVVSGCPGEPVQNYIRRKLRVSITFLTLQFFYSPVIHIFTQNLKTSLIPLTILP